MRLSSNTADATASSDRCSDFKSFVCFSRPTVLPNLSLSVFIKLFKILVTLQSPHFNFLNVCLGITLSWWITNAFPESQCILPVKAFLLRGQAGQGPLQMTHLPKSFYKGKKAILLQLVNGHSQVQIVIHNTEGTSVASFVQSQATATHGTFLFQNFHS